MKKFFGFITAALLALALIFGSFLTGCSGGSQGGAGISESAVDSAAEADAGAPATRSAGTYGSSIDKNGEYTSPDDVALYIHTYHTLPKNYITKNEVKRLGWDSGEGNLDEVAPGKSIGGDRYGNYEKKLPENEKYKECDVNYRGRYRGAERLIYTSGGAVYYTNDHYKSFKKLY